MGPPAANTRGGLVLLSSSQADPASKRNAKGGGVAGRASSWVRVWCSLDPEAHTLSYSRAGDASTLGQRAQEKRASLRGRPVIDLLYPAPRSNDAPCSLQRALLHAVGSCKVALSRLVRRVLERHGGFFTAGDEWGADTRVLASFCLSFSLRCGGRPEGGQGLQTLQLARCELLACAESAEHGVGRYRAVKKATVREGADLKSDIVGSVEAGEVINVLELSSDTAARAAASPQGRLALCGAHSLTHAKCQARALF